MDTTSEGIVPENDPGASEGQAFPELDIAGQSLHLDDAAEASDRAAHLPAEATVRTIGLVYLLSGVGLLLNAVLTTIVPRMGEMIVSQAAASGIEVSQLRTILFFAMFLGCALDIVLGLALRDLKNWARWAIIVVTGLALMGRVGSWALLGSNPLRLSFEPGLGLLVLIIGAGISLYIIFRLLTPESAFVCSKHYRFAVSETLRIRPAMGFRDWALLGVFLANYLLGVVAEAL
jgi:hypothetical protein